MPEPKITYGPAQSRSSRTPILWDSFSDPRQSGEFQDKPSLANLLTNPSLMFQNPGPVIQVDPNSPEDLATTIRHESVHALLDPLGYQGRAAASENPAFSQIAQSLLQARRGGQMSQEAPAYSLTNDRKVSFDPAIQLAFNQGFLHQIQTLDPQVAKALQGIQRRSSK